MYCNQCGGALPASATSCPNCNAQTMMAVERASKVRKHLTLLTALWFAMGALRLLAAIVVFGISSVLLPLIARQEREPIPLPVPMLMTGIGVLVAIIAVLSLAVGWGLYQRAPWARMLGLVMAFFSLLSIPFGTALGIYTLVVLLPAEADVEWKQIAQE